MSNLFDYLMLQDEEVINHPRLGDIIFSMITTNNFKIAKA